MIKINPYILGDVEPALFIAAVLFAMIGILVVLLLGTRLRDPNSIESPEGFSWKYLFSDNAKRIYGNILCVLVTLRFMPEVLNIKLSAWMGFVVGTFWDGLFLIIKQTTTILDPRNKK
jgi:hypothetical protein